jgi:ornithine--oxo-acid transaminase
MANQNNYNNLDDAIINGKPICQWTIEDHNSALDDLAAPIYEPFHGVVVEGVGSKNSKLKVRIKDGDGERITEIVDGLACYSAVPFGHADPIITAGVQDFVARMATIPRSISHSYLGPWLHALANYTGMEMFLPKNGGTEANEAAIKAVRKWGRHHGGRDGKGINDVPIIISAESAFHGRGFGSTTLMDDPLSREDVGPLLPGIEHVPFNNIPALIAKLDQFDGQVGGVILEPIQAEAGILIPAEDYLIQVQQVLKERNVLLVLDEIQTGYGRTGANFAWQLYGLEAPDLMTVGKAMSAGVLPISCLCGRKDILQLFRPHSEGSTFGGYPLASFVGLLTITELERRNISKLAATNGAYLQNGLREVANKHGNKVIEVRGKGMLIGVEIQPNLCGHQLSLSMIANGVYAKETHKTNLRIAPPIVIEKPEMDLICEALDKSLSTLEPK